MAVAVIKLETEYNSIIPKLDKIIKLEDDDDCHLFAKL